MLTDLRTALRPALALTLLFALLLGLAYPLALTGAGQLLFPAQAHARLVDTNWIRTLAWTARGIFALYFLRATA